MKSFSKGILFEYFVTGKTTDLRDIDAAIKKNKGKFDTLNPATVAMIRRDAANVKKHILEMESIQEVLAVENEFFRWEGHLDFIGVIDHPEFTKPILAIVDLKYTSSIEKIWNTKDSKDQFMQAVVYVWLVYKNTGKILPFIYLVAESAESYTIVKPFVMEVALSDIKDFQDNVIKKILADKEFKAIANEFNCPSVKMLRGKCPFIEHCDEGKAFLSRPTHIEYNKLN